VPTVYTPTWLDPDDVRDWLQANSQSSDVVGIERVCAMTEIHVQRARPDAYVFTDPPDDDTPAPPPVFVPDAEVYQGAVMYAARECRRRNNPSGTETFGDAGLTFVSRYDPDIDRALHTGGYQLPGVG
jgi:hypothetical protein